MSCRRYHFSIGVVDVVLQSGSAGLLGDFLSLYDRHRRFSADEDAVEVEIQALRRFPWPRGPFRIRGHENGFVDVRHRHEVLPHLEWMINWQVIQQRADLAQLHAATVAFGGDALILPGHPGSGKTTLAAGLLSRGWSYLCDEFALIDPATLKVHPFPRALCIKEPSFPVMDRLGLRLCRKTPYQKAAKGRVAFLSPLDVRPDAVGGSSSVRWVIFPMYRVGAAPTLMPVSRAQAVYMLGQQCFNFPVYAGRMLDILSDVVRKADCYRLITSDITTTCDLVESRLLHRALRKAG